MFIKDRIYIPKNIIDQDKLYENYFYRIYEEKMCRSCEFKKERHCDVCNGCPAFKETIKLWKSSRIDGEEYFGLPKGSPEDLAKNLDIDLRKLKDLRFTHKFKYPLKFTGKLYDGSVVDGVKRTNQKAIAEAFLRKGNGAIEAPPRTGKTVIGCFIACALKKRTIVFAHNEKLLKQFLKTFQDMTNLNELQEETGKKIVAIVKNVKEMPNLDVALVTYQKFIRDPEKIEKYINSSFSFLIVDEAHQANASAYQRIISETSMTNYCALSATLKRKDHRHFIVKEIMGKTVARTKRRGLLPLIEIKETRIKTPKLPKQWMTAIKHICLDDKRQDMIVQEVFQNFSDGHKSIIIPCSITEHIEDLANRLLSASNKNGKNINVVRYYDNKKIDTDKVFSLVDSGKPTVLVAQYSMIRQGIDMKKPTMIHIIIPMSAEPGIGAPMFEQLSNRVCTPLQGKRQPIVKLWLDDNPISFGCFKSLFAHEIKDNISGDDQKYKMVKSERDRAFQLLSQKFYSSKGVGW